MEQVEETCEDKEGRRKDNEIKGRKLIMIEIKKWKEVDEHT